MNSVAIIIPAFNELRPGRGRLRDVLQELAPLSYTVIVVDDGSTDGTGAVAEGLATVIRHPINRGQGAALVTGMVYALKQGVDILVHFDADGQMQVKDIAQVVTPLQSNSQLDVVLGSRFLGPNNIPWLKKYFLHYPALWFQRLTTGLPLSDVHNGFRAFRAAAAGRLDLQQDGMAHASEIILRIKKLHLRYQEVPVTIIYHEFGQGLGGAWKIFRDLFIRTLIK